MSDTLVRTAACGCVVKRGQHTYEQRVWVVDVYTREAEYVDTLDIFANTERIAVARAAVRLARLGVGVDSCGWLLMADGYSIRERDCCRTARPCRTCANS